MSGTTKKDATIKIQFDSDSGYHSTTEARISREDWIAINTILSGNYPSAEALIELSDQNKRLKQLLSGFDDIMHDADDFPDTSTEREQLVNLVNDVRAYFEKS